MQPENSDANIVRKKRINNRIDVVRRNMRELGVYKTEFSPIIRIYADMRQQYDEITEKYTESGYEFETDTAQGTKKATIVTTLESLRKDILSYASQLGLTPQGLLKADAAAFAKKEKSALAAILSEASNSK